MFRCHRLGDLMTDGDNSVTEKQLILIGELEKKAKRTDNQEAELKRLINKRDNPGLSKTAKTYIREVALEMKYGRKREIVSKYLEKGRRVEDYAIIALNELHGKLYSKNDQRKDNGIWSGEADIVEADFLRDTKSSWDVFSHYANEALNPKYKWQMLGYLELYDKPVGYIDHVLIDTPEDLIQDELRKASWKLGYQDLPMDLEIEIRHSLTFQDIPLEKRVITFEVKRDPVDVQKMNDRLAMAAIELETILKTI
jgi:hypothetical protein